MVKGVVGAPQRPQIEATSGTSMVLRWDMYSEADVSSINHTLYRSQFGAGGKRILDSVVEIGLGSATSFEDVGLLPSTIYGYVLIVSDSKGLNAPSEIAYGKTLSE